ncbi:MAG TPA: DUF4270 family protein [Cyclobacteriaceae bacterium]|nr:DUF4270 family protein [Cyclobacteriaceae bacterium]
MLLDSVFTDQYALSSNVVSHRFLIGEYTDSDFGTVRAEVFSGFLPDPLRATKLTAPTVLDSVTVQLLFDYYTYGPEMTIDEHVLVYELSDTLTYTERYTNNSTVAIEGTPVAELTFKKLSKNIPQSFTLTPLRLDEQLDRSPSARDTLVLWGKLEAGFANRLFQYIQTEGDSALLGKYVPEFRKAFPGFAFISSQSGVLLGFNPVSNLSKVTIHYQTNDTDSLSASLFFNPSSYVYANAFNKITTQRTGGLAGIGAPQEPYYPYSDPASTERYIQDGCAVITELDLGDFYSFVDTLENIVINSAEISLAVKNFPSGINPPSSLYALLMKETVDNKIVPLSMRNETDSLKWRQYMSNIFTDLSSFAVSQELSGTSPLTLSYDKNNNRYVGYATLLFQEMFNNKYKPELMVEHIGLYPATAPVGRTIISPLSGQIVTVPVAESGVGNEVNRAILNASGIKLKVYYTKPNLTNLK